MCAWYGPCSSVVDNTADGDRESQSECQDLGEADPHLELVKRFTVRLCSILIWPMLFLMSWFPIDVGDGEAEVEAPLCGQERRWKPGAGEVSATFRTLLGYLTKCYRCLLCFRYFIDHNETKLDHQETGCQLLSVITSQIGEGQVNDVVGSADSTTVQRTNGNHVTLDVVESLERLVESRVATEEMIVNLGGPRKFVKLGGLSLWGYKLITSSVCPELPPADVAYA